MTQVYDPRPIQAAPILAIAALLGTAVLGVAAVRLSAPAPAPVAVTAVASRDLRFADRPDHGILVTDAGTGMQVAVLPPGTSDFVRMTMRGMARTRRLWAVGEDAPFHLAASAEGRLTISDPATHNQIELEAFGETNADAFALLLSAPETPQRTAQGLLPGRAP